MGHAKLARLAIGSLGAAAGYLLFLRPWHLRWGATDEKIARGMPWDEGVKRPLTSPTAPSPSMRLPA